MSVGAELLLTCVKAGSSRHSDFPWHQAESLQLLHQHLVDAGGSSLDYGPMDRLSADMLKLLRVLRVL